MRGRLVLAGLVATASVVLGAVPSAGAAPPPAPAGGTITGPTPVSYAPIDSPAGYTCPFATHEEFPINQVVSYTYTDASGRVAAIYYTGALYDKVTRVDTGKSVTVSESGDGLEVDNPDGSRVLYGVGPFGAGLHPGDTPGPEIAVLSGVSALKIFPDGHKVVLFTTRPIRNVCLELE